MRCGNPRRVPTHSSHCSAMGPLPPPDGRRSKSLCCCGVRSRHSSESEVRVFPEEAAAGNGGAHGQRGPSLLGLAGLGIHRRARRADGGLLASRKDEAAAAARGQRGSAITSPRRGRGRCRLSSTSPTQPSSATHGRSSIAFCPAEFATRRKRKACDVAVVVCEPEADRDGQRPGTDRHDVPRLYQQARYVRGADQRCDGGAAILFRAPAGAAAGGAARRKDGEVTGYDDLVSERS